MGSAMTIAEVTTRYDWLTLELPGMQPVPRSGSLRLHVRVERNVKLHL
jgi:hypothetical protein